MRPPPRPCARPATNSASSDPSAIRPIDVQNRHPRLAADKRKLVSALRILDERRGELRRGAEGVRSVLQRGNAQEALSVTFVTDAELARLHECYLGDPSPTDVITFPAGAGFGAAGEICVSADAAARRVGSGRPFAAELALYVVHGWLHLAGHDDRNPRSKRRMRRAEARAMALLGRAGALPGFRLLG